MHSKSPTLRHSGRRRIRPRQPDATEAQIARIDALTATGRANWLTLLAYLSFALVTTLGVEDIDFFVDSRETDLPLIGVSIPTFSFFVFAPILGAALYAYLHLHVRKVTEALAEPPPGTPPLEERIRPWLLNDFVLRQRRDGAIRPRPLDRLAALTTLGLVWLAGPVVLGLMWWRTWPAHSLWLTGLSGLAFAASIYIGVASLTKMRREHGRRRLASQRAAILAGLVALCLIGARGTLATRGLVPPILNPPVPRSIVELALVTPANLYGASVGDLPLERRDHATAHLAFRDRWCVLRGIEEESCRTLSDGTGRVPTPNAPSVRACIEKRPVEDCLAGLQRAVAAELAREWADYRASELAAIETPSLTGRRLARADLRRAAMPGVELWNADLRSAQMARARLESADFSDADLAWAGLQSVNARGATFAYALLERTDFRDTQLDGARFFWARGTSTSFSRASLREAYFEDATLPRASFANAVLTDAYLYGADLENANLNGADASRAQFVRARLDGASLRDVDLTGANLAIASLVGADLSGTRLVGADLDGADLQDARFDGAVLQATVAHGADFRSAEGLTQAMLSGVVGDGRTLLPSTRDRAAAFHVASCYLRVSEDWEHLIPTLWRRAGADPAEAAERLEAILCAEGEIPRKSGTPWPLDQPPPWETDPDWQPEDRGPVEVARTVEE